ncbi:MAG: hypothetical protein KH436_08425 [Firmicutes bacterium]|nr:hypothetical protein [Bacillota bacterium]
MITYTGHQQRLNKFISEIAFGDLEKNAIRAADYAGIPKEIYNEYLVIKVERYYNIVHVVSDDGNYPEIDIFVYPFDENRIYPMQKIEQKISYKVY